jgi:hypothetical protein
MTIILEARDHCPACNGTLQFGYDSHGERVFCEDCADGLKAGMERWTKTLNDYAEALALYDHAEKRDQLGPYTERCRTEMQDAYDMAKAEHDRLEAKWARIRENESVRALLATPV